MYEINIREKLIIKMAKKFSCNRFSEKNTQLFADLYNSRKFSDVTLVCDDKTEFKAHKFILSSHSSVFENILQDGKMDCIFLQGMKKHEIESILQFIYTGEVVILEGRTTEFKKVIDSWNIKLGER